MSHKLTNYFLAEPIMSHKLANYFSVEPIMSHKYVKIPVLKMIIPNQ
jgi:hypothetical protein